MDIQHKPDFSSLINQLEKGSSPLFYVAVVPINALGQVLLGRRKEDGIWTTPAGGASRGESPVETAVRECWEESGLAVFGDKLELISVKATPNGKPIHCYLYRTHQIGTTVKMDPDREVDEWNWYSRDQLPDGLSRQKNQNRLETINQAFMKFYGLVKATAGEGSRGGKVIGHTKSGKAIYAGHDVHSYAPHKFSSGEHHEAAQHHYNAARAAKSPKEAQHHTRKWASHRDMAERMKTRSIRKSQEDMDAEYLEFLLKSDEAGIREHADGSTWKKREDGTWKRSKGAPKEQKEQWEKDRERMIRQVIKFKGKMAEGINYRAFLDSLSPDRLKKYHGACVECNTSPKELEKSNTSMMHQDGLEINTADFAIESKTADPQILEELHKLMEGFEFGDLPREYKLPKGMLYLSKVDDGVYSGYFKKQELTSNDNSGEISVMEDNAKVRIERQTLPTLVQFLAAKEWLPRPEVSEKKSDDSPMNNEQIQALEQKLSNPLLEIQPTTSPIMPEGLQMESELDKKIRVLELLSKLLS